jgi:arylsulfatase A-like enzyme
MDVSATALAVAGVEVSRGSLDGIDLSNHLNGNKREPIHPSLFWRVGTKNAIRQSDWKLIRSGAAWRLYNLANDPSESHDLASVDPVRVHSMSAEWDRWNQVQAKALW